MPRSVPSKGVPSGRGISSEWATVPSPASSFVFLVINDLPKGHEISESGTRGLKPPKEASSFTVRGRQVEVCTGQLTSFLEHAKVVRSSAVTTLTQTKQNFFQKSLAPTPGHFPPPLEPSEELLDQIQAAVQKSTELEAALESELNPTQSMTSLELLRAGKLEALRQAILEARFGQLLTKEVEGAFMERVGVNSVDSQSRKGGWFFAGKTDHRRN